MPESIVERYERILRADPASRVFVELARALLERGEPERAAETCAQGVHHHPDSVLARIVWGKALLALGRQDEAIARFDEATRIDPDKPFAYDLAGEVLVAGGLFAQARALLERGTERHPRDPRIQLWLERATQAAANGPPPSSPAATLASAPPVAPVGGERPPIPPPLPPTSPVRIVRVTPEAPPLPPPRPRKAATAEPTPEASVADEDSPLNESLGLERPEGMSPFQGTASGLASDRPSAPEQVAAAREPAAGDPELSVPIADQPLAVEEVPIGVSGDPESPGSAPVVEKEGVPADVAEREIRVPDDTAAPPDEAPGEPQRQQAPAPPPPAGRALGWARHHVGVLALITLVLASSVGVATFLVVRNRQRVADARSATEAARAGLARDTLGSLRQASRVLNQARKAAPRDPETAALLAEVSALLAHDFGDGDARGAARGALASTSAGRGTYATRWLVGTAAERDDAVAPLLANRNATPLASAIAGQVLLSLGEVQGARAALERAANEHPPMLRAITLLGDLELATGELATARDRYQAVLRMHATHPRAALGMAEVSLASGIDLPEALQVLEKISADRESAVPLQDRIRFDLLKARLLALNGRAKEAVPVLDQAAQAHPARAEITAARAQVLADSGDLSGAIVAARTAIDESRGDARYRELMAELQLRHGRYRALLAGTEKDPTRTLRTYRCRARLALGDIPGARGEIEATRRDGKMTPEAAAWAALVEIAAGRAGPVTGVVDALLEQPLPHPAALLARGRLDLLGGRQSSAEHNLREAMGRDPDLLDARVALSELLLQANRTPEALDLTRATVARSPSRGTARVAFARALIANGQRADAVAELAAVLANAPEDPPAEAAARQLLRTMRRQRPKPAP